MPAITHCQRPINPGKQKGFGLVGIKGRLLVGQALTREARGNQVADEAAGARQPGTGTRRVFYPSAESVAVGTFPPADQALTNTDEARMSTR